MNPYNSTTAVEDNYPGYTSGVGEEVDLNKYPAPVDSSSKIRGKSELLETCIGGLEPELITAKGFYFFFFAAFGSLFPLMGVYFKQLGLNGAQAGILTGIRPLVELVSAGNWVNWAEKLVRCFVFYTFLLYFSCFSCCRCITFNFSFLHFLHLIIVEVINLILFYFLLSFYDFFLSTVFFFFTFLLFL